MPTKDFIKGFEGLQLEPYQDEAGVWTVGWGHTKYAGLFKQLGFVLTTKQAEQLIALDISIAEQGLHRLVKVPLTAGQITALTSWVFNFNEDKLESSTLLTKLNSKDYAGAAQELLRWIYVKKNGVSTPSKGLLRRREAERKLFLRIA